MIVQTQTNLQLIFADCFKVSSNFFMFDLRFVVEPQFVNHISVNRKKLKPKLSMFEMQPQNRLMWLSDFLGLHITKSNMYRPTTCHIPLKYVINFI